MVNTTRSAASAGRHKTAGRPRPRHGQRSRTALIRAGVTLTIVSAVLAPTTGWHGGEEPVRSMFASSGGPIPEGDASTASQQAGPEEQPAIGDRTSPIACVQDDSARDAEAASGSTGSETAQRCVGDPTILITLRWNNNNDEDLHVVEPDGTEIAYYSPGPTQTGGVLDRDDNVGICDSDGAASGIEHVTWAAWTNPDPGTYNVRIEEFNPCSEAGPAPADWTAQVYVDSRLVDSRSGTTPGTTPGDTVAEFDFEYSPDQSDDAVQDTAHNNGAGD